MCDEDKQFYRVWVERVTKNLDYTLYFIDHGLYEQKTSPNLFKATPKLLSYTDLASYCKLAYIRLPNKGHAMYDAAYKYLTDLLETVNNFLIVNEDDLAYHVVVNQQGEESLNLTFI